MFLGSCAVMRPEGWSIYVHFEQNPPQKFPQSTRRFSGIERRGGGSFIPSRNPATVQPPADYVAGTDSESGAPRDRRARPGASSRRCAARAVQRKVRREDLCDPLGVEAEELEVDVLTRAPEAGVAHAAADRQRPAALGAHELAHAAARTAQANGREIQRKRHGDRAGPEAEA